MLKLNKKFGRSFIFILREFIEEKTNIIIPKINIINMGLVIITDKVINTIIEDNKEYNKSLFLGKS